MRKYSILPSQVDGRIDIKNQKAYLSSPSNPALHYCTVHRLDHQALDLGLDGADLVGKLGSLVGGDAAGNNGAAHTGRATESDLAGDIDVGNVLVLAKQRKVQTRRLAISFGLLR